MSVEELTVEDVYVEATLKVVRVEQPGELPFFQFLLLMPDDPREGDRWRLPEPME